MNKANGGVLHGGITSALLDEVLGRVAIANDLWMVTAGEPVRVMEKIVGVRRRLLKTRGEIRLADGTLAVEATATLIEAPEAVRTAWESEREYWQVDS